MSPLTSARSYRLANPPSESAIVAAVLRYLNLCPAVAMAWRQNTGGMRRSYTSKDGSTHEYHIRFGFPGISDILGMLKDGRLLAVECKRLGQRPTVEQVAFLARVRAGGGVAIVATSVEDVARVMSARSQP